MKQERLNFWHIPLGILVAMVVLALMMCGCKSIEYVPVVEKEVHHDTVYYSKLQRDSIWLHDSVLVREKGDTVWMEKWHTKYVEKQVHDTTYVARIDSIPVPYEVPKYIEKPLGWWQKALIWIGIISLMGIVLIVARWVSRSRFFL